MNSPSFAADSIGSRSEAAATADRYRRDIQALRGLAILLVLVYHSRLFAPLKAGYLGVDIFFVVSGYLITGIIQRGLLAGTFSFKGFYLRRAKRLLPAAYATFLATSMLAAWFLTRQEMHDYTWQLLGAVTFTGNIALWMQTGYFEGAAHLKPLLHVWSLSIEEQYYMIVPAALVFTPRRSWRVGACVVLAISLGLCLVITPIKPGAAFYLLPTRLWELAIGSVGILVLEGSKAGAVLARGFWLALAALLLVPLFPISDFHPGVDALLVCTATLIVILRHHAMLERSLLARILAWFGDISYSLYLVHWPLLAFAANAWVSPVPGLARLGIALSSVALAWAMYRYIEQPGRRANIVVNSRSLAWALAASSVVVLTGFGVDRIESSRGQADYAYIRRANVGLDRECEYGEQFEPKPQCESSASPKIMVWGDSYAMHIVDGVAASTNLGVVQATKSTCGPLLGVAVFRQNDFYDRHWAEGCIRFNQSVLDYLANSRSVDVIILSSPLGQYLTGNRLLVRADGAGDRSPAPLTEVAGGDDIAVRSLGKTVAALRKLGKRVVLFAPPPSSGFDIGRCLELKSNGKIFFGADDSSCEVSEARYRSARMEVLRVLDRISRGSDVSIVRLDESLCHMGKCLVELDGTFLYRDEGHLSHEGSRLLGRKLDFAGKALAEAR